MLNEFQLSETIDRIRKMELYFDIIGFVMQAEPDCVLQDIYIKGMLEELVDYYSNGQWIKDFECDERGELPSDLKRGVLSEDGVYNLLCDIHALSEKE